MSTQSGFNPVLCVFPGMAILFMMSQTRDLVYEHQTRFGLWVSDWEIGVDLCGGSGETGEKSIIWMMYQWSQYPDILWLEEVEKNWSINRAQGHVIPLPDPQIVKLPSIINNSSIFLIFCFALKYQRDRQYWKRSQILKQTWQMFQCSIVQFYANFVMILPTKLVDF